MDFYCLEELQLFSFGVIKYRLKAFAQSQIEEIALNVR